jgi:glycosyltransferase involved in cell wall biosynthesis
MNEQISPLVSVVIPTFNHGHYLGRALQSVINQSYTNWEAIVIDNHSTDNTDEVIFGFSDKRISYLKFQNNGVIGASRNAGIKVAKGEWIAFLDSDDWWHPDKLKEFHGQTGKNLDVFYHELEVMRPSNSWRRGFIDSWQVRSPVQIDLLMRGNALATSSVVVRREILNRTSLFNESHSMIACEDYNLWLQLGGVTNRFHYCPKVLGYYMDDGSGMSRRDMSAPYKHAIASFMHSLNSSQKKYVEARVDYTKLRYAYLNKDYVFVIGSALETIANGPVLIRVKSIALFFLSVMKSVRY